MTIHDVERLNDLRWMRETLDRGMDSLESLHEHLDHEIAALERALDDFERAMDTHYVGDKGAR